MTSLLEAALDVQCPANAAQGAVCTTIRWVGDDILVQGDLYGSASAYTASKDAPALVMCSDGTRILAWCEEDEEEDSFFFQVVEAGPLYIDTTGTSADPVLRFRAGLTWVYVANEWEVIK